MLFVGALTVFTWSRLGRGSRRTPTRMVVPLDRRTGFRGRTTRRRLPALRVQRVPRSHRRRRGLVEGVPLRRPVGCRLMDATRAGHRAAAGGQPRRRVQRQRRVRRRGIATDTVAVSVAP